MMVKWMDMPYTACTFELERDLVLMNVRYESQTESFKERCKKLSRDDITNCRNLNQVENVRLKNILTSFRNTDISLDTLLSSYQYELESMKFKGSSKLRDYQASGVSWLLANYIHDKSSILADEMGLGKVS